jgi:hypothetical protein
VAKKRKTKRHGATQAKNQEALAALVGRSPAAVSKWLRRADWPFARKPPWDAVRVAAWALGLSSNPAANAASPPSTEPADLGRGLLKAKIQVTANRALLSRLDYDRRAGKLHDVAQCQERRLRQIHATKTQLLELPAMAGLLVAKPKEEIGRLIQERVEKILAGFAAEPS